MRGNLSHTGSMPKKDPRIVNFQSLADAMEHQSLVMEAILAELRLLRGMTSTELKFLTGQDADAALRLDEFQDRRHQVFGTD